MIPPRYYGHSQSLGDLDIFASDGRSQPVCDNELPNIIKNSNCKTCNCNHIISFIYLIDSIRRPQLYQYTVNNTVYNWGFYAQAASGNINITDDILPKFIPDFQ